MIRIGHGNGHNEKSLVTWVHDADADSFGCNESGTLLEQLEALPRRRVIKVTQDGWKDRRANSSCIVTADKRENLGQLTRKVSEALPEFPRAAPDRVLIASFFGHPLARRLGFEGVAHFNLHPDAGLKVLNGDDINHPLVREYTEALVSTAIHMRSARQDGLLPILTGDLQVGESNNRPWSPKKLLAQKLNLDYWSTGIDWILFDKRLELVEQPTMRKLHDHTGFLAELKERAK